MGREIVQRFLPPAAIAIITAMTFFFWSHQSRRPRVNSERSDSDDGKDDASPPPPVREDGFQYDVFLSFRGPDTRKGFTGHLYQALKEKGIITFIDSETLEKGQNVEELYGCIERSKILVPIFSKGYADSKWCLKEIDKMVQCNRLIIPVFFDVNPKVVCHQIGSFERPFRRYCKSERIDKGEVNKWSDALRRAGRISGYNLADTEGLAITNKVSVVYVLDKLRVLKLNGCWNLAVCPNFIRMPHLEKLDFEYCERMRELDQSIGHLNSLTHLSLRDCHSLVELPQEVWQLISLEMLDLTRCYQITALPSLLGDSKPLKQLLLGKLKVLNLRHCRNLTMCPDFTSMPHLEKLDFGYCQKITGLHPSIGLLKSLIHLSLGWCESLKELPEEVCQLTSLQKLDLSCCSQISTLPISMRDLKQLNLLSLVGCSSLEEVPECICSLLNLQVLNFRECRSLASLPNSIGNLKSLEMLDLSCTAIEELPDSIALLEMLEVLSIAHCKRLKFLPASAPVEPSKRQDYSLPLLPPSLTELHAEGCYKLETIADVSNAKGLLELDLRGCERLMDIPGIEKLNWLKSLKLGGCRSLSNSLKKNMQEANFEHLADFSISGNLSISESSDACSLYFFLPKWLETGSLYLKLNESELDSVLVNIEITTDDALLLFQTSIQARLWRPYDRINENQVPKVKLGECEEMMIVAGGGGFVGNNARRSSMTMHVAINGCLLLDGYLRSTTNATFDGMYFDACDMSSTSDISFEPQDRRNGGGLLQCIFSSAPLFRAPLPQSHLQNDNIDKEEVNKWSAALAEAGKVSGYDLASTGGKMRDAEFPELSSEEEKWVKNLYRPGLRNEAMLVEHIVRRIMTEVNKTPLFVVEHPVGLNSRIADLMKLLEIEGHTDARMVGIHGLGGMGKTTVAKAIYNQISCHFDASCFLFNGTENIEAIQLSEEKGLWDEERECALDAGSFAAMSQLRMLKLGDVTLEGKYEHIPQALRRLQWHPHDLDSLPDCLPLANIVVLDLSYSTITQVWNQQGSRIKVFHKLKVLSLNNCWELNMCPDFTSMPHLEKLDFSGCWKMRELHPSIGHLERLTYLSLSDCLSVKDLPASIRCLKNLIYLSLRGCKLKKLPKSTGHLKNLSYLSLRCSSSLKKLPEEVCQLTSLEKLNLNFCTKISTFPLQLRDSTSLTLYLFDKLKVLNLSGCNNLTNCMPHVEKLKFNGCNKMSELHPSIGHLKSLSRLSLGWCESLKELPDELCQLASLENLYLNCCKQIAILPSHLGDLSSLVELFLDGTCTVSLPKSVGHLKQLKYLSLNECSSLKEIPECICMLLNLEQIDAKKCESLALLPNSLGKLISLRELDLSETAIEELPDSFVSLEKLDVLAVAKCTQLKFIPASASTAIESSDRQHYSLPQFPPFLTKLKASNCLELEMIADVSNAKGLKKLNLNGCRKQICLFKNSTVCKV
ncbi:Disease resistance protein [Nymphaea thermarum]|nr:Disease resistance protein [Nymphaea thermarum]